MEIDVQPIKPRRGRPFEKGNKVGKQFGQGQPTNLGGVRKSMSEYLLQQLKSATEELGIHAHELSKRIIEIALDRNIDPKIAFPFIKEAMVRVHGNPKNSFDEILKCLLDKQNTQTQVMVGLSLRVSELAALNDVKGVIAQLDAEGMLEPMLKEIRGKNNES